MWHKYILVTCFPVPIHKMWNWWAPLHIFLSLLLLHADFFFFCPTSLSHSHFAVPPIPSSSLYLPTLTLLSCFKPLPIYTHSNPENKLLAGTRKWLGHLDFRMRLPFKRRDSASQCLGQTQQDLCGRLSLSLCVSVKEDLQPQNGLGLKTTGPDMDCMTALLAEHEMWVSESGGTFMSHFPTFMSRAISQAELQSGFDGCF